MTKKQKAFTELEANLNPEENITACVKFGGYIYWDFKFPFIHRKPESLYIGTQQRIHRLEIPKQ